METSLASLPARRGQRLCLALLVGAWGLEAIVTQSLLVREALVLMFGSEFAWGIVLFAWLFGVAVGAAVGGALASRLRHADSALIVVLLLLGAAGCAELWIFRGARGWLGVGVGELLPLSKVAIAAMLFVSPASALVGLAFPFACRVADVASRAKPVSPGAGPLADVYGMESLGSLIGGAAFSFWAVEHLAPIETLLYCGAVTAATAAAYWAVTRRCRASTLFLGAICIALVLVAASAGNTLNDRLIQRRWQGIAPGYELCARAESRFQSLAVGRRADQYTLYCDGHVAADFPDPYTFVPLAHFWMCQHPDPRRVLILGGGAEGLLAEVLRHPVEHVDYVEPDPRQIELVKPFLPDPDRRALGDPRVTVHNVDARYFVKTQQNRFDLVIARLPEPISALRARFYTDEFYGELRRAMTDRSVLCMTAAATPADLPAAAADYLASIRATLHRHFPQIIIGWGDTAQVLAATAARLITTDPAVLTARYEGRGVHAPMFDPLWFDGATDWLDSAKVRARAGQLDAATHAEISTDLRPALYLQRLVLWERMTGGQSQRWIERLRAVHLPKLMGVLALAGAATLIFHRLRSRRLARGVPDAATPNPWAYGVIVFSVATTGFATMALSIIWLFAFQNLYGYVYQRIGWIIALFMGGLVVGCWFVSVRSKRWFVRRQGGQSPPHILEGAQSPPYGLTAYLRSRLIAVDVVLALLSLSIPFLLPALERAQGGEAGFLIIEWVVSILVAISGLLGGAAFALAGGLQLAATGRAGTAAGNVVGADHAGACIGALLTGVLLVPVYGTAAAALLLAGMKFVSAAALALISRASD